MITHKDKLNKAILLRKKGYSLAEISNLLLLSKSTLSLWLRGVEISDEAGKVLSQKKRNGQIKGAMVRKKQYELQLAVIISEAERELKNISERELWLLGVIAYWCEGAKQKKTNISQCVVFSNSDPFLLKLIIKWLKTVCQIGDSDIKYNLCVHQNADINNALSFWKRELNINKEFGKVILKKHRILTKRKNIDDGYHGLLRITVSKSTNLNRKIAGWFLGITKFL